MRPALREALANEVREGGRVRLTQTEAKEERRTGEGEKRWKDGGGMYIIYAGK